MLKNISNISISDMKTVADKEVEWFSKGLKIHFMLKVTEKVRALIFFLQVVFPICQVTGLLRPIIHRTLNLCVR